MAINKAADSISFERVQNNERPVDVPKTLSDLRNNVDNPFKESKTGDLAFHSEQIKHNLFNRTNEVSASVNSFKATGTAATQKTQFEQSIQASAERVKQAATTFPETAGKVLAEEIEQLNARYGSRGGNVLMSKLMQESPKELANTLRFSDKLSARHKDAVAKALNGGFENLNEAQKTAFGREMAGALGFDAAYGNANPLLDIIEKSKNSELFNVTLGNLSDQDVAVIKNNANLSNRLTSIFQNSFENSMKSNLSQDELKGIANVTKINPQALDSSQLARVMHNAIKSGGAYDTIEQKALGDTTAAWLGGLNAKNPNSVESFRSLFNNISKTFAAQGGHLDNRDAGHIVGTIAAGIGKTIQTLNSDQKALRDFRLMLLTAVEGGAAAALGAAGPAGVAASVAIGALAPFINDAVTKGSEISLDVVHFWMADVKNEWTQNYTKYGWDASQAHIAADAIDTVWQANMGGR